MAVPTYRQRLTVEGGALMLCGAIATMVLLLTSTETTRGPASTLVQLTVLVLALAWFGPRGVSRAVTGSEILASDSVGSGEPTPLWHIAAIVVSLTVLAGEVAGWDAGLRVTLGCMLVGATQVGVLGPQVRRTERHSGRTYYRVPGSRILRGTRLGYVQGP
jgi:hypothetical protein